MFDASTEVDASDAETGSGTAGVGKFSAVVTVSETLKSSVALTGITMVRLVSSVVTDSLAATGRETLGVVVVSDVLTESVTLTVVPMAMTTAGTRDEIPLPRDCTPKASVPKDPGTPIAESETN